MMIVYRFAAYWLAVISAFTLGLASPAAAQDTPGEYSQALGDIHAQMNALTLEIERFTVNRRYCRPPDIPSKAEAQAELEALAARSQALNRRYSELKQNLKTLAQNARVAAELALRDADPTQDRWWLAYEAARRRMADGLARKRAALAAAPELDCSKKAAPPPAPVLATGGFQAPATPQRPAAAPMSWPALPRQFCTQQEYWDFINRLNLMVEQVAADLERAAKFRAEVEAAINAYVQKDQSVPASLLAQRRQANADFEAQQRRLREADETVRRAKAIPVVDCGRGPRQTGMSQGDMNRLEAQQSLIGEAEGLIAEIDRLRRAGECDKMERVYDRLLEKLYMMNGMVVDANDPEKRRAFPKETIDDLRRRAREASQPCPPPGFKSRAQILAEARRAYRTAAQGNDPRAFQEAKERLLRVLDEEIAVETRDAQSDRLIRERSEVRTGEFPRSGVIDEMEPRTAPPTTPSQTGFVPPPDRRMAIILQEHNNARTAAGAPPLKWNPVLADHALARAQEIARIGQLAHAPREGRGTERENIARLPRAYSPQQMMAGWLSERRDFVPGTFPNICRSGGDCGGVLHLSQILWPTTTDLGCGVADGHGYQWLVCRYDPGGNKDGRTVGIPPRSPTAIADGPAPGTTPPPTSEPAIDPRELARMKIGGGMTQIDPPPGPPPPPPTARDPAPDGDEARHPLRDYFMTALHQHEEAFRAGDLNGQADALAKMHYALQELLKRLRAARKLRGMPGVNPADIQKLIDELNRLYRAANEKSRPRQPGEERG